MDVAKSTGEVRSFCIVKMVCFTLCKGNEHSMIQRWNRMRKDSGPIATVRHRTIRSKGCLSNRTAHAMVFKLLEAAQKAGVVSMATSLACGLTFNDGI
jgi:hypothetical protein